MILRIQKDIFKNNNLPLQKDIGHLKTLIHSKGFWCSQDDHLVAPKSFSRTLMLKLPIHKSTYNGEDKFPQTFQSYG